jgi:hypothetical protein
VTAGSLVGGDCVKEQSPQPPALVLAGRDAVDDLARLRKLAPGGYIGFSQFKGDDAALYLCVSHRLTVSIKDA